ncbi:MAG: molybdopterin molybdotransferase MoeA [Bacteroidales bacterium]|nr:molybdopterin molybdotransferase MoeA [Bacteroidales bacterium]MCB8999952.1 molybdopterin molybdotransferase MoeA [Bacteroidales bacterium]MCB9012597.1 molybdopterin molybdotransferase MoeA [Bacteroidales bacterium]
MINFEEADAFVRSIIPPGKTERVPLANSLMRVLAEDVVADMNMPPFNKSAVDGFACRREDLGKALRVTETIAAGSAPKFIVDEGLCTRIMTGAEVPVGADCVIMLEETEADKEGNIIFRGSKTSSNICLFAEDVKTGEKLVSAGTLLKPRHIPVLASMGYVNPLVYKQPSIGILCTGSELVDASQKPSRSQIRNSNGPQLEAQCSEMGLPTVSFGIIADSKEKLRESLQLSISKNNVSIISGGVSVGDFDYAPEIIIELGFEIHFHGMNVKPGKRILFASRNGHYIFGLPGNPVSALVQFEMLVKPLLLLLQHAAEIPSMEKRMLREDYKIKNASRLSFVPVMIESDGSVRPVEYHGSAHIFAFASANGFMKVPKGITILKEGDLVDVRCI